MSEKGRRFYKWGQKLDAESIIDLQGWSAKDQYLYHAPLMYHCHIQAQTFKLKLDLLSKSAIYKYPKCVSIGTGFSLQEHKLGAYKSPKKKTCFIVMIA